MTDEPGLREALLGLADAVDEWMRQDTVRAVASDDSSVIPNPNPEIDTPHSALRAAYDKARAALRTPAASDGSLDAWTVDRVFDALAKGEITEDAARDGIKALLRASDGSLDVAWAAAEAACEKRGLVLEEVARFNPNGWWTASAWEPKGDVPHTTATEKGVVAALTKLVARLSESPSEGKTE